MSLDTAIASVTREMNEDCRRGEFLRAIDAGVENLSEWEINFIQCFLGERALKPAALDHQWFTDGRRRVVDNMIHRYGFRKQQTANSKHQTSNTKLPEPARDGCCNYLTRQDGRLNVRCGERAVTKLHNGLELCQAHLDERTELLEKVRAAKRRLRS